MASATTATYHHDPKDDLPNRRDVYNSWMILGEKTRVFHVDDQPLEVEGGTVSQRRQAK
jgi:hypothetical protein